MPTAPDAPNSNTPDGTNDDGTTIKTTKDGNRTVASGAGTYTFTPDGKLIKYDTPKMGGLQQTHDLVKKQVIVDYGTSVDTGDGDVNVKQKGIYDMSGKLISGAGINIDSGGASFEIDKDGHKTMKYQASDTKNYTVSTKDKPAAFKTLAKMQKDLNINKDKVAPFNNKST